MKSFIYLILLTVFVSFALAKEKQTIISFDQGLKLLLKNNAQLMKNKAILLSFEANIDRAKNYPRLGIMAFVAPVFETNGNALNTTKDYYKWGPYVHTEASLIWPIFNFGSIDYAKQAAKQGFLAKKKENLSKLNEVIFQYKKLYLSLIYIKKLNIVLNNANKQIFKILSYAKKQYNLGTGKVKRKDLAKLNIFYIEIQKLREEIIVNKKISLRAISHYLNKQDIIDVKDNDFPENKQDVFPLEKLISYGRKNNPKIKAIRHALKAYKSTLKLNKALSLPVFFLGLKGSYSYSNVREDQNSTFANDRYNDYYGAIAIGAKWNFDFSKSTSKRKKSKSKYKEFLALQTEAKTGLPLKISIANWKRDKFQKFISFSQKKMKEASRWLLFEKTAYETGVGDSKDLLEALSAYLFSQKEIVESEFNLNVQIAKLALEIGNAQQLKKWISYEE